MTFEEARNPQPQTPGAIPHIGTYRRVLPVSLERMYENTIDWAHLPYLHRSSFGKIECVRADASGFRAWVWPQRIPQGPPFLLELTLDRELRRWISRTVEGPGTGSEIWTQVVPISERRIEVSVDFYMPNVPIERVAATREFLVKLYKQLYDEDEQMMTRRQVRLDEAAGRDVAKGGGDQSLGAIDEVRQRLPLSIVNADGREFRIVAIGGELIAYAAVCPHLLGPIGESEVREGIVECPWHGYRFDVHTGACVSGARCRLAPAPRIEVDRARKVIVHW